MAKKKSSSNKSGPSLLIGILIAVIGFIFYLVTGVDLVGITEPVDTTTGGDTVEVADDVPSPRISTGDFTEITFGQGFGYQGDFWQLYFTSPVNSRDRSQYSDGVDVQVARMIDNTNNTLDIAAFELNSEAITEALVNAHERGVTVRVVTDDEHGLEDDDSTIAELELAGIPIVDDDRSGLMHNKFIIMDGISIWLGSMNFTVNGSYRNNNNGILLRSRRAVEVYQAEFDEMFEFGEFGITSDPLNTGDFTQDGVPIEIYYGAENNIIAVLEQELGAAQESIRFMAFAFTLDEIGDVVLTQASNGVTVEGVFEVRGSETEFSEFGRMHCTGLDVRQDGNNGTMHHKVFIIDESTVITGSFNFSNNASRSNDENILIIRDGDIAALFTDEFLRVQSIATPADDDITC